MMGNLATPYITVASSGDNGCTWTDEYPTDLTQEGLEFIASHNPQDAGQHGFVRVYWGEGPEDCDEYALPLSPENVEALKAVMSSGAYKRGA